MGRAHDDKIVIHDGAAVDSKALLHKLLFELRRMHQRNIYIPPLGQFQGLSRPHRDHVHLKPRSRLEGGDQDGQEAGVFGAGRRREAQSPLGRLCWKARDEKEGEDRVNHTVSARGEGSVARMPREKKRSFGTRMSKRSLVRGINSRSRRRAAACVASPASPSPRSIFNPTARWVGTATGYPVICSGSMPSRASSWSTKMRVPDPSWRLTNRRPPRVRSATDRSLKGFPGRVTRPSSRWNRGTI